MRTQLTMVAVLSSTLAYAETPKAELSADEIRAQVKSSDSQIEQCYLGAVGDYAGAGRLEIKLTIHRKGIVDAIEVTTPGLPAKTAKKVDTCVRAALDGLSFPVRRLGTTAVVPYFWQKTASPGSGPQESCWDAKGCKANGEPKSDYAAKPVPVKPAVTGRQARRAKAST